MARLLSRALPTLLLVAACGAPDRTNPPIDDRDGGGAHDAGPEANVDGGTIDGGDRDAGDRDGGARDGGAQQPGVCVPVRAKSISALARGWSIDGLVALETGYLLVYQRRVGNDWTRYAVPLDASGEFAGEERLLGPAGDTRSDVIADGDGAVLVAMRPLAGLAFTRLDATGAPVGSSVTIGPEASAAIAAADEGFGVVYAVGETGFEHQLWFRRLDDDGRPVADAIALTDGTEIDFTADIAWNGTHFGVAFQRQRERTNQRTHFFLLDADGVRQTTTSSIPDDVHTSGPSLTSDGDGFLLATGGLGTTGQLRRIDASGDAIMSLMTTGPRPNVVWDGERYVFATTWFDVPLDLWTLAPRSIPIPLERDIANESASSFGARVAWDGLGYAITWTQNPVLGGDVAMYFARVCP